MAPPAAKSGKSNLLLAGGGGGGSDRCLDDGRIDVLRSPWIARLASAADPAGMCRAPFDHSPTAAAAAPFSTLAGGLLHPEHPVAGFGPFQVNSGPDRHRRSDPLFPPYLPRQRMVETLEGDRNRRWRAANGGGGSGVRLSPFFRRLHPPAPPRSAGGAGAGEGGRLRLVDHPPSAPGGSMRRLPTAKGNGEETPTHKMFDVSYPALLHHPHERLAHAPSREPKEQQQPLPSLWNMGRFKAEDMRTSVAAPIASATAQLSGKQRVVGAGGRLPLKNQRPSGWIFATPPPPPPSSQSPAAPRAP